VALRNVITLVIAVLIAIAAPLAPAEAKGRTMIRDAEIESIIRGYTTPLFQAAGLNPRAIDIYLIQDRSLNAFVAGGQNIFIHTGLLIRAEDPLQVIGVLAHETGHITGGHIAGRIDEMEKAQMTALASYLLGIGAAILSGRPEAAAAVISGGQDLALKGLLSYTRSQEQAADQAAVRLLNGTQQSPRGLLEFMDILGDQEILLASSQDPYLRTHPLTQDRIIFLEDALARSRYANAPPSPELVAGHARVRAKLIGFLESPVRVFRTYPPTDNSVPARYARAIAYFKRPDLKRALPLMDGLIAEMPNDPFFHELKGQMLFENGRVAEALPEYEIAVGLMPDTPQLRLALAQVQIELNTHQYDEAALDHLEKVLHAEPRNAFAWRLAAVAHGRLGDKGMTSLALAEGALSRGRAGEAREQAARALHLLPKNSPSWLQAQDVAVMAKRQESRQRKRR
jgi:predicted Zn-dependent protease